MTDLKDKAVSIKGKDYVLVKDRIMAFNADYKDGAIKTEIHSYEGGQVIVKATVVPDVAKPERVFTGYSQARENDGYINKTSALENAETSAVGRALAMMGIGVIDSVASADEINKAGASEVNAPQTIIREPVKQDLRPEELCGHERTTNLQSSRSAKHPNRWFQRCDDCGKFLKWLSGDGVPRDEQGNLAA